MADFCRSALASSNLTHHNALYQFTNPELRIVTRGEIETSGKDGVLKTEYYNGSFPRGTITEPANSSSKPSYANGRLMFDVVIEPGKTWHTCINFIALADGEVFKLQHTCTEAHEVVT